MTLPPLSLLETRVLGVLVEKQRAVPDTYPLSLNALTAGCNQKSSRDPVIDASEAEVQATVDALRSASLVVESSGGRVMRYAHNLERALDLPAPAVAILAVLMLRGPQTAGELRINCDRLHRFADISAVEGYLQELAARPAGAFVVELPRAAGMRENRWAHLLSGPVAAAANVAAGPVTDAGPGAAAGIASSDPRAASPAASSAAMVDAAALARQVDQVQSELQYLREEIAALRDALARRGGG
jgi:uncharacterized protein YceH (UPF0502 family)